MSGPAIARIAAYVVLMLVVGASILAWNDNPGSPDAAWREPLRRMDTALARGDVRTATLAWEAAHRAAMGARAHEGMLEVGRAALRIGEAAEDRQTAMGQARRSFLSALFRARGQRDPSGVARAGEAFEALGDREVAERAFRIATALVAR